MSSEILNFDWKRYLNNYKDLKYNSKEEAWNHWINYGKYEGRNYETEHLKKDKKFNWKMYIENYEDLNNIKDEKEAWNHWINYGKHESRTYEKINFEENDFINFNWETYVNNYFDLQDINNEKEAWNHWINHGKNEGRTYEKINFEEHEFIEFDWQTYVNNYDDLKYMKTKKESWIHYISCGLNEERVVYDINKKELDEYNDIIEIEDNLENIDYNKNKIIFKRLVTNCGKHYFGWKCAINYYISTINESLNENFKNMYYFDEWLEKLLVWGNKIQNNICLKIINENNLKLITFLHNPPFELFYKDNKIKQEILLNDDSLLNKNIFHLINEKKIKDSITFLYVLSNHHKQYIYDKFPEIKNKVLSIYHPINIDI